MVLEFATTDLQYEFSLQYLATGGERELSDANEILRHVVFGEPFAAKMFQEFDRINRP